LEMEPMNKSDTPRTDELIAYAEFIRTSRTDGRIEAEVVPAVFARTLEREINKLQDKIDCLFSEYEGTA